MNRNNVRFIHSFSTKPLKIDCYSISGMNRLIAQVWYFTLSFAYLKQLGATIVLHTDSFGKKLLEHIPYDEIHLTLDNMPEGIHPRFWAAGKFVAIQNEKPPFIHIDGDVFIKSEKLLNTIEKKVLENDLLIQSDDPAKMYTLETPIFNSEKEFCEEHSCFPDGKDAYNTGILGIKSTEVRDKVCSNYLDIVKYFSKNYKVTLDSETYITPDLIAEQKMIRTLSDNNNWKVDMLLKNLDEAMLIDYQHVYTSRKITDLDKCKETLSIINKDLYEATAKIYN